MPSVTIPTSRDESSEEVRSTSESTPARPTPPSRRSSPAAQDPPPVSPITPQLPHAQLASASFAAPENDGPPPLPATNFIAQPQPVPISESDNTDAIALRAAISTLQLQRDKAKRDIRSLRSLRDMAIADPEGYAKTLVDREKKGESGQDLSGQLGYLGPTLGDALRRIAPKDGSEKEAVRNDSIAEPEIPDSQDVLESSSDESSPVDGPASRFPEWPRPQNVFRCPPINWAKYHIAGEALDKLHAEQQQRPTPGQPVRDDARPAVHTIAAPYDPFKDVVEHPMQTRKGSKKPD